MRFFLLSLVQLNWVGCTLQQSLRAYRHWASLAKIYIEEEKILVGWVGCPVNQSFEAYIHWDSKAKIEGLFELFCLFWFSKVGLGAQ